MTTRVTMTLNAIAHMSTLYMPRFVQAGPAVCRLNVPKSTSRLHRSSELWARHCRSRQRELAHGLMRKCQLLFDQLHRHV